VQEDMMHESMPPLDRRQRSGMLRLPARLRRRPPRSSAQDAGIGIRYWLAVLAAGGMSVACVALGLSSPEAAAPAALSGKNLHADHIVLKLNHVPTEEPAPSQPAPPDRNAARSSEPPQQPAAPHQQPPAEIIPVAAVAEAGSDPAVYLPSRESTPGESPMIRTWNTLAAAALLAAASPPSVPAGETNAAKERAEMVKKIEELRTAVDALSKKVDGLAATSTSKDVLSDLKRVEKAVLDQIDKVNRDLGLETTTIKNAQLNQKIDLQSLNGKIKSLDQNLELLADNVSKLRKQLASDAPPVPSLPAVDKAALDSIFARLGAIEKALAVMSSKERVAFSPPPNGGLGKVMLTNLYAEATLFTVNGTDHVVQPGQSVEIRAVPAGPISYTLFANGWGITNRRTTTLGPNETLSLTAR
jgi:hypothetical protein